MSYCNNICYIAVDMLHIVPICHIAVDMLHIVAICPVLGTASFFFVRSAQIRYRISIFLIRNRKSAIARLKA